MLVHEIEMILCTGRILKTKEKKAQIFFLSAVGLQMLKVFSLLRLAGI